MVVVNMLSNACLQIRQNTLDLPKRVPQVLGDLLGQDMRIGEIRGVLEALVAQPEQVEAELVARQDLVVAIWPPASVRRLLGPRRFALMTLAQAVTGDEIVEVGPGHRALLEREVLVRPKIIDPDRLRP